MDMDILLVIVLIVLGGFFLFANLIEGMGVFVDGWHNREWPMCHPGHSLKEFLLSLMTLPGAILGFVVGIIAFRWTDSQWWR